MYNSRPRYNRFSSEFNVPENYSGNAFFEEMPETKTESDVTEEAEEAKNVIEETKNEGDEAVAVSSVRQKKTLFTPRAGFGFDVSKLFGGGIGFEELLILGLILLMAQSEGNEDMIVLLALLLFIG